MTEDCETDRKCAVQENMQAKEQRADALQLKQGTCLARLNNDQERSLQHE